MILDEASAGGRVLYFPTMMNLRRLAASSSVADALAAAQQRPLVAVTPRVVVHADGSRSFELPEEAGYGSESQISSGSRE